MMSLGKIRMRVVAAVVAVGVALPGGAFAAEQSVADIREELTMLSRQVQEIREALVATGPARGLPQDPATAFQRLDQLEDVLRRLTNRVDVLTNDLNRVVQDASNRAEDIEFRLTELEGGDVSLLGRGEQLGGGITQPQVPPVAAITGNQNGAAAAQPGFGAPVARPGGSVGVFPAPSPGGGETPQLAVGEQADFEAAKAAHEAGRHGEAVTKLTAFIETYPGGPLAVEAQQLKADALAGQGNWREAARTYLDAFSGAPDAPQAPQALHGLAVSLGQLGQTEEACLTLTEVDIRYPGSAVASDVADTRRSLGCR
jgi:tol-pal system protein YbgF